jgi:hypothetical protein
MTPRPRPGSPSTATTDSCDALVLRSPDAIVAALPYLLGFTPQESAVVVWIRRRRVVLTQRLDLPTSDSGLSPWLAAVWDHGGARSSDEIIVLLVTSRSDGRPLSDAIRDQAAANGQSVRDILRVADDRWWSLMCTDEECCPPHGRIIDPAVRSSVAAEFTVLGVAPLESRRLVVESLGPVADEVEALSRCLDGMNHQPPTGASLERWRDEAITAVMDLIDSGPDGVGVAGCAALVVAVADIRVRDTVLWECAQIDAADLQVALAVLAAGLRAAPDGLVAPVASCFAVAAWLAGDGARAVIAADRALADDPGYSLAQLVHASLRSGLSPQQWRSAMRAMPRADCRRG